MRCSKPTTAIASELSLESHFQRLVTTTAELMGARYAALGVIDRSGRQLERFSGARLRDALAQRRARSAVRVGAFALAISVGLTPSSCRQQAA